MAPSDQPASGDLRRILSTTAQINSDLTATGLHLMPDYAKHAPHGVFSQDDLLPIVRSSATSSGWDVNAHFFGVLFSGMLLSLGAPFWFNVPRQATSLRPIVANLAQEERKMPRASLRRSR